MEQYQVIFKGTTSMSKTNVTTLKKYLDQLSKQALIAEISDLFVKFDYVNDYYAAKLNPVDAERVLQKYKTVLKDEFFPSRGFGTLRASVAKKAISDYKKVAGDPHGLADLMLFYIEMGVKFVYIYGDIKEIFYTSMESMYAKVLELLFKQGMQEQFQDRCEKLVRNAGGIGYGLHDTFVILYRQYYGE
jgi:hypothetical protein